MCILGWEQGYPGAGLSGALGMNKEGHKHTDWSMDKHMEGSENKGKMERETDIDLVSKSFTEF